jgi:hypothetical protein
VIKYDERADMLRDRDGVNVKLEPVTPERELERERERADMLAQLGDMQAHMQCPRAVFEKRRELMVRVARV